MTGERFWISRLRWRLRGATQWPAFALFTVADGVALDALPPLATSGLNLVEGLLVATFGNLFLVGAVAPPLTRRLAARRATALEAAGGPAPVEARRDVLQDRVATTLLALGLVGVIVSGLANRPVIVSETEATERNAEVVRDYVAHSGDAELTRNLETANTIRLGEGYFRTCIARDDRRRHFCLFVDTRTEPPKVVEDQSVEPNSVYTVP